MSNPTTELEDLIQYWKDNYAINYVQRSPSGNERVLKTIKLLEELQLLTASTKSIGLPITK
ncbi:hypothetical protein ES703_103592 [subsurface metagenome]